MITQSMTRKEIGEHFKKELETVSEKFSRKALELMKKMKKAGISQRDFTSVFISKNKLPIIYYYTLTAKTKQNLYTFCTRYNTDKGLCYVTISNTFNRAKLYTSHFFKRFAERFLKDENLTVAQTAELFLRRSDTCGVAKVKDSITETLEKVEMYLPIGVCLGYMDLENDIIFFNTFVSHEMLGTQQQQTFENNEDDIKFINQILTVKLMNPIDEIEN